MKILNLYAGIGGNRKLWGDVEVTAVELDPDIARIYQDYFPDDKVIVADAHAYLLEHYKDFDFIWSSPPCPTHTRMNVNFGRVRYADMVLYQEIILLQTWFKSKFCIENVIPYYKPLIPGIEIDRHIFWTNFIISPSKNSKKSEVMAMNNRSKKVRNIKRWMKDGNLMRTTAKNSKYGFDILNKDIKGQHKEQILNNLVNPETGLYILNCAMNIITKENIHQADMFIK